jgi:hypothetical protein
MTPTGLSVPARAQGPGGRRGEGEWEGEEERGSGREGEWERGRMGEGRGGEGERGREGENAGIQQRSFGEEYREKGEGEGR